MRDTCIGCPSLEEKDCKSWCFYYQSWVSVNDACGNNFDEKPEFTQEEYEIIAYDIFPKYCSIEKMDSEKGEDLDIIMKAAEEAREEMRQIKAKKAKKG